MTEANDPNGSEESPLAAYRIELERFQGPLDLLLHLIQKNEVDIRDIPIAQITAQYLQYLEIMKELDLEIASEFLVMASNLVYIKSRTLLPVEDEEEDGEPEDPREELVRRLLEYRKYKEAARILSERPALHHDIFPRPEPEMPDLSAEDFTEATLFQLMDAFQKVLSEAEKRVPFELERDPFTLDDALRHIRELLLAAPSLAFTDLFTRLDSRRKIVTVFMGVLEMVKQGHLIAVQRDFGEPITVVLSERSEDNAGGAQTSHGEGEND
jgi:segregation and condensation protein A